MSEGEFLLFRRWVGDNCAVQIGDAKKYFFETRLARFLIELELGSFLQLYNRLIENTTPGLHERVIDAVTTHETSWFRDESTWIALRDELLPELLQRAAAAGGGLRIWSAACSTGQEPYSLAMMIDDLCRLNPGWCVDPAKTRIIATDISVPALVVAMAGRYDPISMRRGLVGPWERMRAQYFTAQGQVNVVSPDIRGRVDFEYRNLRDPFTQLGTFDLILLRYAAIYFSAEFKEQLWPRLRRALRVGGNLILGAAETLTNPVPGFVARRSGRLYSLVATDDEAVI